MFAGAESVILSAWEVDDRSAAKLFIKTYEGLGDHDKAHALRQAKLALLKNRETSHPYFWGPYLLMGEWKVRFPPNFKEVELRDMRFKGLSAWRRLFGI